MKDNKSQPAKNLVNSGFPVTVTKPAKLISISTRFETSKKPPFHDLNENSKIMRRHSFDDNGGGYQGL